MVFGFIQYPISRDPLVPHESSSFVRPSSSSPSNLFTPFRPCIFIRHCTTSSMTENSKSRQQQVSCPCANSDRRLFLKQLSVTVLSICAASLAAPEESRADRTGKYSTKLTAKKRYLPRIEKAAQAIQNLNEIIKGDEWKKEVIIFCAETGQDLETPLSLFASSYFSEGNRIGAIEKELKSNVEDIVKSVKDLEKAAKSNLKSKAETAYLDLVKNFNLYLKNAKLEDIPSIALD